MRLLVTPTFAKATRKLPPSQKIDLDAAVRIIGASPYSGEAKVGDLLGVRVYQFTLLQALCLLVYRIQDQENIKLLSFGPHENFYRDLKRQVNK